MEVDGFIHSPLHGSLLITITSPSRCLKMERDVGSYPLIKREIFGKCKRAIKLQIINRYILEK